MKRIIALLLCLLLALGLLGCAPQEGGHDDGPAADVPAADTPAAVGGSEGKIENEYKEPTEPFFAVTDSVKARLITLSNAFCAVPQEFTDPSVLTDETLFFAAAIMLDGEFEPAGDNDLYALPLERIEQGVGALFGPGAQLSEDYRNGNYEPYAIDGDRAVKYGTGGLYLAYYPLAVVELPEGGYELWMLDLMDDAFRSVPEYDEMLMNGETDMVTWEMLAPIVDKMQTNIYTFQKDGNGGYYLTGFRYKNFHDVSHFLV